MLDEATELCTNNRQPLLKQQKKLNSIHIELLRVERKTSREVALRHLF